jgi:hypothetical protein
MPTAVRTGERLEGVAVAGASAVDQSAVTGESIPVEVAARMEVFGGTERPSRWPAFFSFCYTRARDSLSRANRGLARK